MSTDQTAPEPTTVQADQPRRLRRQRELLQRFRKRLARTEKILTRYA